MFRECIDKDPVHMAGFPVDKVLDCGIALSEFKHQSRNYVHSRTNTLAKGMNALILPAMVLNRTSAVLLEGWFWH